MIRIWLILKSFKFRNDSIYYQLKHNSIKKVNEQKNYLINLIQLKKLINHKIFSLQFDKKWLKKWLIKKWLNSNLIDLKLI